MPETPEVPEELAAARRTVLRGAAVAAAASLPLFVVPSVARAASESEAAKKPKGKPVCDVKDVPVGGGKWFEKEQLIVTQPAKGKFKGFKATCTHANCPVSNFETKGKMICECHNGEFDLEGKPVKGPVRRPMNPEKIRVEKGKIYKG